MMGAMMFNSANRQQQKALNEYELFILVLIFSCNSNRQQLTNEDEGQADEEGQDVTTERLVVLPITLCKHTQSWINVVLT